MAEIRIGVDTAYVRDQSDPAEKRFVFAYTITISNLGDEPAKLLNRHWVITDGNGDVREVRGAGVVGEQPHLQPGEQFRYTSGAILNTEIGSMRGSYEFRDDQGDVFEVDIPVFTLAIPNMLH